MKWLRWLILSLLIFIGVLVAQFPAATALHFAALPKGVAISGASGSIWQGRIESITHKRFTAYDVTWQLAVMPLLSGTVQLSVSAGQNPQSLLQLDGQVELRSQTDWQLNDVKFSFPAPLLGAYRKLAFDTKLQGQIRGYIAKATPDTPWCDVLDADLVWQDASISSRYLKPALQLNDVEAKLSCDKGDVVAVVRDPQKVLGMDVVLRLDKQKHLFATGVMQPANTLPKAVKQGLVFVAQPEADGRYHVQFDTQL